MLHYDWIKNGGQVTFNPGRVDSQHEGRHVMGLGDEYYWDTGEPVPGHSGHLMVGSRAQRAAQDEIDRLAGYMVSMGQSQGVVTWLPGAKTSFERTQERKARERTQ